MPMIRHGQHDGINVLAGHHLAVIVVGLAVLVLVVAVDCVHRLLEMLIVQVAGGDYLAVFHVQEFTGVAGPLHAPADHTQRDAPGRGGCILPAQGAGRDDRRCGKR